MMAFHRYVLLDRIRIFRPQWAKMLIFLGYIFERFLIV